MSNSMSRVTVHSRLTAVPHAPITPGKIHSLSALDHAMGIHTLHIIFYYKVHNPVAKADYFDLGPLRQSLGDALSYYPPVTGRLQKDERGNWQVKCNDAGIRVLRAKVDCSFDEWLRSADADEEKDLAVWEEMSEDPKTWSPYRIQLNDFTGGGLAIGLSCPHMQADPTCATLLMKTWSEMSRRTCISHAPIFDSPTLRTRSNTNTRTNSINTYEAKSKFEPPPTTVKMSAATFRFSDTTIKKFLVEVQSKCPDATPFDLLSGIFSCAINNMRTTPRAKRICNLSLGTDFRNKIHASVPHEFFGNALHFSALSIDASEMEQGGSEYTTQIIHDHLSAIDEEYCSVIHWLESKKGERDMKPVHVSYHIGNVEGEGLIMVLPSPEEGLGRTVMVTLPQDQIHKLCNQPGILLLEPTMLVSGSCSILPQL